MAVLNQTEKIKVEGLYKAYGKKTILDHIGFSVYEGEFLSVLGSSGCGKTTLLRILIGITEQNGGRILKDGVDISSFEPAKRGMGIVFQNYALFPNMTELQNVEYALKLHPDFKASSHQRALEVLSQVGMEEHSGKKPDKLSGGQQQRVAIARTLALQPDVLLFDEPLSALDASNRLALRRVIKDVQKKTQATVIYITHDQEEAFTMSDRIMVMSEGTIEQIGTPQEIFHHPKNAFVESFVVAQLKQKMADLKRCVE